MNDLKIQCRDGHTTTSSRLINEHWDWLSHRLQSSPVGRYVEVDYPTTWVTSFLSWIYTKDVPSYDTLDCYSGMLVMAADSMKTDLFRRLEDILTAWDLTNGADTVMMWQRSIQAASAKVQNFIVDHVKADPLRMLADPSFYKLSQDLRTLLCKRVSDGRRVKDHVSVYLKRPSPELSGGDRDSQDLDGLTLEGLTVTPFGSLGSMSTMESASSQKPKTVQPKVPSEPPIICEPELRPLPYASYSQCRKMPEEGLRKLREEMRQAVLENKKK